jgi:L-ascorbate metabolism protein UlaG (beta-lactamase superfamily)
MTNLVSGINWLGHDSFRIEAGSKVIYIDPWQLSNNPPQADIILITHDHGDHCSPEDVTKIQNEDTVIVTISQAAEKLSGSIEIVKPGDHLTVMDVPIEAVPAYNVNKFRSPGVPFHPKEAAHVGFVITLEGRRIYHTGDSDLIPEMKNLQVDVALLPVSGTYVMTAEEAITAAAAIKPKIAIPMHVGRSIGSLKDTKKFKSGAAVPVEILPLTT